MSDKLKMRVTRKGDVKVNFAYVQEGSSVVMAVGVDLKSKWAQICSTGVNESGSPTITFEPGKSTYSILADVESNSPTEISFPQLKGWTIWSAECSRYTARVCLIKNKDRL